MQETYRASKTVPIFICNMNKINGNERCKTKFMDKNASNNKEKIEELGNKSEEENDERSMQMVVQVKVESSKQINQFITKHLQSYGNTLANYKYIYKERARNLLVVLHIKQLSNLYRIRSTWKIGSNTKLHYL